MTVKQKEWDYNSWKVRAQERTNCRAMCWEYNRIDPADMESRNKKIKEIIPNIGTGNKINQPFMCDYGTNIYMGNDNYFNHNVSILDVDEIVIGNNCQFAPNVLLSAVYHPLNSEKRKNRTYYAKKIIIEDNVWICSNAVITAGVKIGKNSVVAAGAVVTSDVPESVLVAGVPAKVVKKLDLE